MEQLINFIIRPPRAEYNPDHDLLDEEFLLKGKWYQRKDMEIKNSRGDILKCSHYMPIVSPEGKNMPCVIYCHGNSGCRADASEAAIILLPSNITVFALDLSGSGLSGGEHVTLGWNEKDDLKAVVDYLRAEGNISLIGLWGRSMGAVTSLMYGSEDPSIAGMVLDSPFSDLVDLMMELVDTYKFPLPKFTVKFAIQFMRKAIQKKAKFDIMDLNTIKVAKSCFVPALFGHAVDDDFIRPHHSDRVFESYVGDKNIIKFEGDHNSPRPQFYFDSINIFFHNVLQPPEDEVGERFFDSLHNYVGKGWAMPKRSSHPNSSTTTEGMCEAVVDGTENAIEQVRSKRPMSRMEVPSDTSSSQLESKENNTDAADGTSSSRMINFELSNGHPVGPHVPTTTEDDNYLEYEFDDLAGFPSNVEEEERMVMEAIIQSLKDLELRHPQAEDQIAAVDTSDAAQKSIMDRLDDASNTGQCVFLSAETNSNKEEKQAPSGEPRTAVDSPNVGFEHTSPDSSISNSCMSTLEAGSAGTSARSDASASVQSSSDGDMSSSTKATLTVERNPSNHIMDGLMRRWDLNFFRNGRQKSSTDN